MLPKRGELATSNFTYRKFKFWGSSFWAYAGIPKEKNIAGWKGAATGWKFIL